MKTRRMILESAGHRVIDSMDVTEVKNACAENTFDVAVIGQSLPPNEKLRIQQLLREVCPSAKLLELHSTWQAQTLPDADDWLQVPPDRAAELAERVTALAMKEKAKGE